MADENPNSVLEKAFGILDTLSSGGSPLGLAEISRRLDLPKATAHRLLSRLRERNLVLRDGAGCYLVGPGTLVWAGAYRRTEGLAEIARPHLRRLLEETGETVHLFVYEGGKAYYLDKLESPRPVRMMSRIGSSPALYCTSAGRAILSRLPASELEACLAGVRLEKRTPGTVTDTARLRALLERARDLGYAEENGENEEGIRCIGAAILDERSYPVGALSVTALAYRFGDESVERVGVMVRQAAAEISGELGCRARTQGRENSGTGRRRSVAAHREDGNPGEDPRGGRRRGREG